MGFDRKEVWARVVARAWADEDFKASLLADPKVAILEETGVLLPADLKLRVVEEQAGETLLVLPKNNTELTEDILESIAGGEDGWGQGPCTCLVG